MLNKFLLFFAFLAFSASFAQLAQAENNTFIVKYENVTYEKAIQEKDKNVLLIVGADWCGMCIDLKNDLRYLNLDDYVVCIIDCDERKDLAVKYQIKKLPTSVIINNKKEVGRLIGYSRNNYQNWIDKYRK